MAEDEGTWQDAVEAVRAHVVRIRTPRGSGTGFFFHRAKSGVVAIATAAHVVDESHYWEEPIRIQQPDSDDTIVLRVAERAIFIDAERDTAAILVPKDIAFPEGPLGLVPEDKSVRVGVHIGWLGFPAVAPDQLCFFGGRVSAFRSGEYLVDGVAINGVSGGPAFHLFDPKSPILMGVLSAYIPNRATGATLPGLAVIRDLSQLHEVIKDYKSFEQAKEQESTPTEPPPPSPDTKPGDSMPSGIRA